MYHFMELKLILTFENFIAVRFWTLKAFSTMCNFNMCFQSVLWSERFITLIAGNVILGMHFLMLLHKFVRSFKILAARNTECSMRFVVRCFVLARFFLYFIIMLLHMTNQICVDFELLGAFIAFPDCNVLVNSILSLLVLLFILMNLTMCIDKSSLDANAISHFKNLTGMNFSSFTSPFIFLTSLVSSSFLTFFTSLVLGSALIFLIFFSTSTFKSLWSISSLMSSSSECWAFICLLYKFPFKNFKLHKLQIFSFISVLSCCTVDGNS